MTTINNRKRRTSTVVKRSERDEWAGNKATLAPPQFGIIKSRRHYPIITLLFLIFINAALTVTAAPENDPTKNNLRTKKTSSKTTPHPPQWETDPPLPKFVDDETHISIPTLLSAIDFTSSSPETAAANALSELTRTSSLHSRLTALYTRATSPHCRAKIAQHYNRFLAAIGTESHFPYEHARFRDECPDEIKYDFNNLPDGVTIGDVQNRTYMPQDGYYVDYRDLRLCYGILTHENPRATIRLMEALDETYDDDDGGGSGARRRHTFVVHVDGKEGSDETYEVLVSYAATRPHVHILPVARRVRVNWGGFSMVNATLQILRYAMAVDDVDRPPLEFHKFVHVASTTYPLRANSGIRRTIARYPLDANLMNVVFKPTEPHYMSWHYFVECDDAVHRIFRLSPLEADTHGIDIYTASQWFIISREFARYLALAPPRSLVRDFIDYASHVVVADESFFGTVLRHTYPFCKKHHNDNFLHVQFDRWENELEVEGERDEKKCLMPNPEHCGRSPTTMSLDYLPILELSEALFARKFLDHVDSEVKDVIDKKRAKEELRLRAEERGETFEDLDHFDTSFEGHGVLIVANDTLYDDVPLCLGLGPSKNKVRLTPCFDEGIRETLAPGWETGAVILPEIMPHNRWILGPCSTDGTLKRFPNGTLIATPGEYSASGPRCNLKQMDGLRKNRCMDGESDRVQPGGEIQVFPCVGRWHQLWSFGVDSSAGNTANSQDALTAPGGSIHMNVPLHVRNRIRSKGRGEQVEYMCVGVTGRGGLDEELWSEDEDEEEEEDEGEQVVKEEEQTEIKRGLAEKHHEYHESDSAEDEEEESRENSLIPLSEWIDAQVVTTRCDNVGAVIEWVFIPFVDSDNAQYEIVQEKKDNASPDAVNATAVDDVEEL